MITNWSVAGPVLAIIDSITYKPGLKFKYWTADHFIGVQIKQEKAIDSEAGGSIEMGGHPTYIPVNADKETVVRELYFLCLRWEKHELDEFFKVDGKRPYNPHHNIDVLLDID